MADRSDLDARAVASHGVLHAAFDGLLVLVLLHVDEIDDDEPGEIAQPELARQFVSRLEVGLERRFLDVALACRAARVDVDGDKRLGLVDDKIATRFQGHLRTVDCVHLLLDLIALEDRQRVFIFLDAFHMAWDQHLHLRPCFLVGVVTLDKDLVDLAGVKIADRPFHEIAFLVDQAWCLGFQRA